jgi:hypothetical protein
MGNRLTRCLVSALPAQSTPTVTGGPKAHPLVNMSQKIGQTGLRRRNVPCIPAWLCAASHRFRNRGHDCPGHSVSHSTVTNRCLGKHQTRHYGIHVMHLDAFALIKCCHVSAGGTAPPLQSHQVQISSKLHEGKDIGPTCEFTVSPEVGPEATIGTL